MNQEGIQQPESGVPERQKISPEALREEQIKMAAEEIAESADEAKNRFDLSDEDMKKVWEAAITKLSKSTH